MSNKPKIYAPCKAGCQWETVHKSDFDLSASHIPQNIEESGICYLQEEKEYKIFAPKNDSGDFDCSLVFSYLDNGVETTKTITFTNEDEYAESFVFRFLEASATSAEITLVYEFAGVRYSETISGTNLSLVTENALYVNGATSVLLYNADATIKAEQGEKGEKGEKGDTGEVTKRTIKEFINFFEFEEVEAEFKNGYHSRNTGKFKEDPAFVSAKIPVTNGEVFSLTGGVLHNNSALALVTYLDSENAVVGTEFNSDMEATSPTLYNDEIVIIPPNVAYLAFTSRGQDPFIKKIKNKNIIEYINETKYYEYDLNSWDGVDVTPEKTYTTNSIWSQGKIISNSNTINYNAYNEAIEVIAGATYKLTNFYGIIDLTNASHTIRKQLNLNEMKDWEITIPNGYSEMGVSILSTKIAKLGDIIRITPVTIEEKKQIPIKIHNLIAENIADEVKEELKQEFKEDFKDFKGVKIVNFGDSIFGNARPPQDVSTKLAELTGATVYNCAFGGTRAAEHKGNWDAFSFYRLADAIATGDWSIQDTALEHDDRTSYAEEPLALLKSIDFSSVDIITIAYGTNDLTGYVTIDNDTETHITNTFAGALRYSIETLLAAYPNLKIFLCTPTWRFWQENGAFTEDSDTKLFLGKKLTDFVDKIKAVAAEYHLKVIDNYHELGINKFNRTNYFPTTDGTHHNKNGRDLIARHIAKELF